MFRRQQTIGKCQRSCFVHPVGVRSDLGDATAEAESIPLDYLATGTLFVFLCNFIRRSNPQNSPHTAQFLSFSFQQRKTSPNRPSDTKFMAVLRVCCRFCALHTRRPGKFCWNADRKPQWARSCSIETRKQENATDLVPSAPYVSEAMKEMRRQKRNPYYWTVQALETSLFLCNFIERSNQLNSPPMVQFLLFSFQQKNQPQSAVRRKI